MTSRQGWAMAATVVLGLAIALGVLAVAVLLSLRHEYINWHWWADPITYQLLGVPVVVALVGGLLVQRARRS